LERILAEFLNVQAFTAKIESLSQRAGGGQEFEGRHRELLLLKNLNHLISHRARGAGYR
jgi:hypothetical protein